MRLIKQHFLVITTSFLMTMTYGQPPEERMQAADRLGSAIAQIDHYYIKPMPLDRLMGFAISGMLTQLDPHSSYLNEEDLQVLIEQTEGDFAGIGVEMIAEDSLLRVISPIEGSVADRSGIKPDDIIVAIDGTLVDSLTADEAQRMVRGEVGTTVDLVVFRQGVDEPLTFHLTREQVVMQEVRHRSYGDIGLIRIAWFTEGTADEVRQHITTLRQENPGLKGLILDLRNNPGGVLDAAAGTADLFLDQGDLPQDVIVSTKGRHSEHDQVYRATPVVTFLTPLTSNSKN